MQGFPIGGSRIRLSWGRSQCTHCLLTLTCEHRSPNYVTDKAAQAAAQAAQAAAFQSQYQVQVATQNTTSLTAEQAMALLEKFGLLNANGPGVENPNLTAEILQSASGADQIAEAMKHYEAFSASSFDEPRSNFGSGFSPFSPDPSYFVESLKNGQGSAGPSQAVPSKGYVPWFAPNVQDEKVPNTAPSGKVSPTSGHVSRPSSARAFGNFLDVQPNRSSSRQEGPIARPDLPRRPSQSPQDQFNAAVDREHDSIHDLNGTLASLNLDNKHSWKSAEGSHPTSS